MRWASAVSIWSRILAAEAMAMHSPYIRLSGGSLQPRYAPEFVQCLCKPLKMNCVYLLIGSAKEILFCRKTEPTVQQALDLLPAMP